MGKVFLNMELKAERTKENNNGSNYMEIREFYHTKISWTKLKGKGDTRKNLQYIWHVVGKQPYFIKIFNSVRKGYANR